MWKFANFSPTIFCKHSVKLTVSLKSYAVNQFDEKFLQWGKISEITTLWVAQLWQMAKNSVKSTFSLKSYTVNQFDEKLLQWGKISEISSLWGIPSNAFLAKIS